jgi:hypothetical protein
MSDNSVNFVTTYLGRSAGVFYLFVPILGKGKAIPLHPWTGLEGFRRLRLPHFKSIGT